MTDKELLELAAKSVESKWLSYHHTKGLCCRDDSYGGLIEYYWNPLTDDGDALRLAVQLNLFNTRSKGYEWPDAELFARHEDDPYAATRLAIVRAAAEMGRAK
jgi:hypothetical protein